MLVNPSLSIQRSDDGLEQVAADPRLLFEIERRALMAPLIMPSFMNATLTLRTKLPLESQQNKHGGEKLAFERGCNGSLTPWLKPGIIPKESAPSHLLLVPRTGSLKKISTFHFCSFSFTFSYEYSFFLVACSQTRTSKQSLRWLGVVRYKQFEVFSTNTFRK
jgi:hypothetical protein